MKPPAFHDDLFDALATKDESYVKPLVEKLVLNELNPYLNSTILAKIPSIRAKCGRPKPKYEVPFGAKPRVRTFSKADGGGVYWFTYNYGGRADIQFHVGMVPGQLAIGLGFEFGPPQKKGGDPQAVTRVFQTFQQVVASQKEAFDQIAKENNFRAIEVPALSIPAKTQVTKYIVNYPYQKLVHEVEWICVGRFLKRGIDKHILEDPDELHRVITSVTQALFPFWEDVLINTR